MGYSGNLAGESMEQGLPKREDYHRNSVDHIIGTDGIFTVKEIIVGGLLVSLGFTWCGSCLFFGWNFGKLVFLGVRSLITMII